MNAVKFLYVGIFLTGVGSSPAQTPTPLDEGQAQRAVDALRVIQQALQNLPPGQAADRIKEAAQRLKAQVAGDLTLLIKAAESNVSMWEDRAAWSERMVKRGFLSEAQAQADQARLSGERIRLQALKAQIKSLTP